MSLTVSCQRFAELCQQETQESAYPRAREFKAGVPIYEGPQLINNLGHQDQDAHLKGEWAHCLLEGPGVFGIRSAYSNLSVLDEMSGIFARIIQRERNAGKNKGDHFGQNERIWNSIQKTSVEAPHLFADYYGNPFIALASRAWLGPAYQLTAQVNIVKPGGAAQSSHRDYHLGFQSRDTIAAFPPHAQAMSQFLTLQGAIIHTEMPVESGPTKRLPFSQQYELGYLSFREPEFVEYFEKHAIQLDWKQGDLLFFNPALYHAAGSNTSSSDRVANLIQISSAFGRPMESINHNAMIEAVYPELLSRIAHKELPEQTLVDSVAALTNAYAFPTNLDSDPPVDGLAPRTQEDYVLAAIQDQTPWKQLYKTLTELSNRQRA